MRKRHENLGKITPADRDRLSYRKQMETAEPTFLAEMPDLVWVSTALVALATLWLLATLLKIALLCVALGSTWSECEAMIAQPMVGFCAAILFRIILRSFSRQQNGRSSRKASSKKVRLVMIILTMSYFGFILIRPHVGFLKERAAVYDLSGDHAQRRADHALYNGE